MRDEEGEECKFRRERKEREETKKGNESRVETKIEKRNKRERSFRDEFLRDKPIRSHFLHFFSTHHRYAGRNEKWDFDLSVSDSKKRQENRETVRETLNGINLAGDEIKCPERRKMGIGMRVGMDEERMDVDGSKGSAEKERFI